MTHAPDSSDSSDSSDKSKPALDRRTLIRSAGALGAGVVGAGALVACGSDTRSTDSSLGSGAGSTSTPSATASSSASSSAGSSSSSSSSSSAVPQGVSVAQSSVPVGGGTILADSVLVVTQPTAGTFKAFSAICTHQGCPVTKVENGTIDCPCHQSKFDITTGAPVSGPAPSALAAKTTTKSGSDVIIS